MKTGSLLAAICAVCLLPMPSAAQTAPVDREALVRAKTTAVRTFVNRALPVDRRLAALPAIGFPDTETRKILLRVGTDRTENSRIRLEALRLQRHDDAYLDVVLKILNDDADGDAELDAGLIRQLGKRTTNIPPPVLRQRIQSTLRKLMDDPRDQVRLEAFRALVLNHDQSAIAVLDESLRRGTAIPIPVPDAIDLINENGPTAHFNALRPYLQSRDPAVQAKAVQALAADPESRQRIVALALSPETPASTRQTALRALAREDAVYPDYAIGLVEDPKTDPAIRDAAMTGMVGRMNYFTVAEKQQLRFVRAVDALAAEPVPPGVRAQKTRANAVELKEYLRKAFPDLVN